MWWLVPKEQFSLFNGHIWILELRIPQRSIGRQPRIQIPSKHRWRAGRAGSYGESTSNLLYKGLPTTLLKVILRRNLLLALQRRTGGLDKPETDLPKVTKIVNRGARAPVTVDLDSVAQLWGQGQASWIRYKPWTHTGFRTSFRWEDMAGKGTTNTDWTHTAVSWLKGNNFLSQWTHRQRNI